MKLTARIEDETLVEYLEGAESKSEAVREGLRMLHRSEIGREHPGLTDKQAEAYNWLLDRAGVGGRLSIATVTNRLSQRLSIKEAFVKDEIIRPLERDGKIAVQPRLEHVDVVVLAPDADVDDVEYAGVGTSEITVRGLDEDDSDGVESARSVGGGE